MAGRRIVPSAFGWQPSTISGQPLAVSRQPAVGCDCLQTGRDRRLSMRLAASTLWSRETETRFAEQTGFRISPMPRVRVFSLNRPILSEAEGRPSRHDRFRPTP